MDDFGSFQTSKKDEVNYFGNEAAEWGEVVGNLDTQSPSSFNVNMDTGVGYFDNQGLDKVALDEKFDVPDKMESKTPEPEQPKKIISDQFVDMSQGWTNEEPLSAIVKPISLERIVTDGGEGLRLESPFSELGGRVDLYDASSGWDSGAKPFGDEDGGFHMENPFEEEKNRNKGVEERIEKSEDELEEKQDTVEELEEDTKVASVKQEPEPESEPPISPHKPSQSLGSTLNSLFSFTKKTPIPTPPVPKNTNSHHFRTASAQPTPAPSGKSKQIGSKTHITDLDVDTLVHLFRFLSVESLLNLKIVSRRFLYLGNLDRVWAERLKLINYAHLDWELETAPSDEFRPEQLLQSIWQHYGSHYRQFQAISSPTTYLATFHDPTGELGLPSMSKRLFRIITMSKANFLDQWYQINHNLSVIREYYEASLLTNLNYAYSTMDLDELKVQCLALQYLEGDNLGIKWLVDQNPIFIYHGYGAPETVDDLDGIFAMMTDYFNKLYEEVQLENELLLKIFPIAYEGNTVFLEQIFQDCVSGFLMPILDRAEEQSDMMPSLHPQLMVKCLQLGQALIDRIQSEDVIELDPTRVYRSLYLVFQPHLETLCKNELLFLDLNYSTLTKNFLYTHMEGLIEEGSNNNGSFLTNFRHGQRKVLSQMTKAFTSPNLFQFSRNKNSTSTGDVPSLSSHHHSTDPEIDQSALSDDDMDGHSYSNPKSTHKPQSSKSLPPASKKATKNPYDFGSYLSLELSQTMIELNLQSLTRITQFLVFPNAYCQRLIRNSLETLFSRLASYLDTDHVGKGFEVAFKQLRQHQSDQFQSLSGEVVGPVLSFFTMIKQADLITNQLDEYHKRHVGKYIDLTDFLDPCNISKKRFETSIDEVVAGGLDLSIQTLMHHVHALLKHHQLPTDFKPAQPIEHLTPTKACHEVVNTLINHTNLVRHGDLDPKVMEVFYTEIGLRLFYDLCKHIKSYTIDSSGGYQLLSDLSGYFSWVASLDIPSIIPHFQALKEVANLYLLDPEHLRIVLQDQDRFQGIFHPEDLLEFVQRRPDYRKIQRMIEVDGCSLM